MISGRWVIIGCSLFLALNLSAQSDSIPQPKRIKILPVPTLGYSPETRTYAGFVALATINMNGDTAQRVSNAKLEFNISANKQFIIEAGWNYFFKHENWFSTGLLHISKYPDRYYGLNADVTAPEVLFESNRIRMETNMLKSLGKSWFVGPGLRFLRYSKVENIGDFEYPELMDRKILGLGLTVVNDQRNNILNAEQGHYLHVGVAYHKNLSDKLGFSYHRNYNKYIVDFRKYTKIKEVVTLAVRSYNQFNSSYPAYFDRAVAGGDQFVRGFFFGRFRNDHLSTLQAEMRLPIYGRFGLATFGGFSRMFGNNFMPSEPLNLLNYGAGVRFMVDKAERINLRMDYAIGSAGNQQYQGFYIAFGESF